MDRPIAFFHVPDRRAEAPAHIHEETRGGITRRRVVPKGHLQLFMLGRDRFARVVLQIGPDPYQTEVTVSVGREFVDLTISTRGVRILKGWTCREFELVIEHRNVDAREHAELLVANAKESVSAVVVGLVPEAVEAHHFDSRVL